MLFKGEIIQKRKKTILIIVILIVFSALCLVLKFESNNSQEVAKYILKIASKVEEFNRKKGINIFRSYGRNLKVSNNHNQGVFVPFDYSNSETTTIHYSEVI